jgi:hypothetical protein
MARAAAIAARGVLAAAVAALGAACGSSEPLAPPVGASNKLTVVVLVVDSLMPHEVDPVTTPNLHALKTGGTWYEESRAVFSAETIPNHVAMMTGVYPSRSGIPSNEFIDFSAPEPTDMDMTLPEELTANTLFTWVRRACVDSGRNPAIRTAATLSKKYLFEIFQGDAANPDRANDNPNVFNAPPDTHWDPRTDPAYIEPESEHTPDLPTMTQALLQLPGADFHFINLGDVDRLAHASGEDLRQTAIEDADVQVGRLVAALQDAGRWDSTVLFVVSDHGMDYSLPGPATAIATQGTLDALGQCYGPMAAVDSGGTEGVFVLDRAAPLADRRAALRAARACLLGTADCTALCPGATRPANAEGIFGAWYIADDPQDPSGSMPLALDSRHTNAGDLVLSAADGYKFAESTTGQIPGNHGHLPTLHNTFIVAGGSPWVKAGQAIAASAPTPGPLDRLPEQSENVDIAPTVAWLLGLDLAPGAFPDYAERGAGFDGRILKEAFTQFDGNASAASPTACGRFD